MTTPETPKRSNQEELIRIYELLERAEKHRNATAFWIKRSQWSAFGFFIIIMCCLSMCTREIAREARLKAVTNRSSDIETEGIHQEASSRMVLEASHLLKNRT